VEGLHLDEEGLAWAPGGQVEPWAVDKQGPVGGLLLDTHRQKFSLRCMHGVPTAPICKTTRYHKISFI